MDEFILSVYCGVSGYVGVEVAGDEFNWKFLKLYASIRILHHGNILDSNISGTLEFGRGQN
jgi:hypothetical protein